MAINRYKTTDICIAVALHNIIWFLFQPLSVTYIFMKILLIFPLPISACLNFLEAAKESLSQAFESVCACVIIS